MTSVVLSFLGPASEFDQALEQLRVSLPDVVLPKETTSHVVADLDEAQQATVEMSLEWAVASLTFADVSPPQFNLRRLQRKQQRGQH